MIECLGQRDIEIEDLAVDSRAVKAGSLFIALKGVERDGHDFISEALQKQARALVLEQVPFPDTVKNYASTTFVRVSDSRAALAHLAPYFFENPAEDLCLIGITGTNGKTTTAYLIDALLRQNGLQTSLLSTITYRLGDEEYPAKNTTPGLLDLHRLFSKMRSRGLSHVCMEVSSHALTQGRVAGLRFQTAVFSNLTEEHLDYHKTMEDYYRAKKGLFEQCVGRAIINGDDPWGKRLAAELSCPAWVYGLEGKCDIYPLDFTSGKAGIEMQVQSPLGRIAVRSPLVGRHNMYNLLAALSAGLSLGLSSEVITAGLASMTSIPGRFEQIDEGQDFTVIVDYAHTADALSRLLSAVAGLAHKRIITLFGCGGDRDRGKRPKMAQAAAEWSHKMILTSDNPRGEKPEAILEEVETGFRPKADGTGVDYEKIVDRQEAIGRAIDLAESGDVVVIAGKGHEGDQQIGNKRLPFDDRAEARSALKRRLGSIQKGSREESNVDH